MLRIEDSSKPKCLPASRALLAPAVDSDANVSISTVTRSELVCLRLSRLTLTIIKRSSFLKSLNKLCETCHC
ncbi:hypothetical protein NPIL_530521 [Nephila pilipes]|uniref:Uncharacterized protein n=1 Tax=Nephila pilipes TaxID=299642 RepID=A0A8X6NUG9_NEPPI|nr:hypothetical protein NPIL_530521 [Nephila pilipes]